jgi:hypothetical protein
MPAEAGTHASLRECDGDRSRNADNVAYLGRQLRMLRLAWIPLFSGMTVEVGAATGAITA